MYIGIGDYSFGKIYPEIPKANNLKLHELKDNSYFDTVVATENVNNFIRQGDIFDIKFGVMYKRLNGWFYRNTEDIPYQFENIDDLEEAFSIRFVSIANKILVKGCEVLLEGKKSQPVEVINIYTDYIDYRDCYNDNKEGTASKLDIIKICKPFTGKVFNTFNQRIYNYYNGVTYDINDGVVLYLTEEDFKIEDCPFIKVVD